MAQLEGIQYSVQSKPANASKWQIEDEFTATVAVPDGEAAGAAYALFDALVSAHSGGGREYRVLRCEEQRYEVRS